MNATPDNTLVDPDQRIADLERQLAESKAERDLSKAERDEALQRETATAEVLQVINSSPGNLTPVFEAMLEKAIRLCGGDRGVLWTIEGGRGRLAAARGLPAEFVALLRERGESGTNSPLQRVVQGEWLIEFPDTVEEFSRSGDPHAKGAVEAGVRSAIWVAIVKEGVTVGAFAIGRSVIGTFSDKQIALLQNFAAQAVIAMENARLLTETREALEQQTATAEVLQVINGSPGNLVPVFDAILEKAHSLCGAPLGSLVLPDGDQLRAVATRGYPQEYDTLARHGFPPTIPFKLFLSGEPFVHVFDGSEPPTGFEDHPMRRAAAEIAGVRTVLFVPLRKDETVLGYISAQRQEVRPFTDKQIALLQNFAEQAVIAVENARLLTETREALEQQTATAEVLQVINSSPGVLAPVFDAILDKAHSLCGATVGNLMLYKDGHFHTVATHGFPEQLAPLMRRPLPLNSFTQRLIDGERFRQIEDIRAIHIGPDRAILHALARYTEVRTHLLVPLRKDGNLIGSISANRPEVRPFSGKEIALLENFAAQAVIAIENARLITETREALEQQTATAEVLQVINSSPGHLGPVFDALLEKATRLCEASCGNLYTYDGGMFHTVAVHGDPRLVEWLHQLGSFRPIPSVPIARLLDGGEPFLSIADLTEEEAYHSYPHFRRFVDTGGLRSSLIVALRKDEKPVGVLHLYRQEVRPFTDKQIALLQNFAAQAVIAMENARLLGELRQRTDEVAELNRGLEARVAEQVEELGRVGRLKRFLAPQLAELIVSQGNEQILESHRREIVVVFCDLRGYTSFSETAEPEEVLEFLREYHGALGPLVAQFEGTLDQFSGDGIMVFFNDPVPCADPAERAVKMAMAMRDAAGALLAKWRRRGRELGFGAGIAQGYATLGQIGFAERSGYTAIGTVCNLAARLCAEANDGQILVAQRVAIEVEKITTLEEIGALALKGLTQPVVAYNVPLVGGQAAFRVIEGGPPSA